VKRTQATPTASTEMVPPDLFSALRQMLLRHRDGLLVVHDADQHFYVNCRTPRANGKVQFFGAVKVSGRRHAFHLRPVYDHPELLADISPALKQRMQGKSCFNVPGSNRSPHPPTRAVPPHGERFRRDGVLRPWKNLTETLQCALPRFCSPWS